MRSHPGDIAANAGRLLQLIRLAVSQRADMIIFPELSLTGYEPTLANKLATTPEDKCFDAFREISAAQNIIIGIGAPLQQAEGITIGLLLHPDKKTILYEKQYLHADEHPFFISGKSNDGLIGDDARIALAICYELSVPAHAEAALQNDAQVYLASVAKTAEGMAKAAERLAGLARDHVITTLLVNCIGSCDGITCAGQSAGWNNRGELLAQLDENREGLLLLDTGTNEVESSIAEPSKLF